MSDSHLVPRAVLSAIAALALASSSFAQTIWHVDASAAPGGDGLSWATAMDSLESAIVVATPVDRIWVREGKYFPTNLADPTDPRSARFRIASHLKLFGGFDGTETILGERDSTLFDDTILSGDLGIGGDPTDNAYRVVELTQFPAPGVARIDGFRITEGNATEHGGGVLLGMTGFGYNPRVKLVNCTLNDNSADRGGAIAVENLGVVHLLRCVVEGNTAAANGGAIYSFTGGVLAVDTRFTSNKAGDRGGALYADSSGPDWIQYANCLFITNEANQGGAVFLQGGDTSNGYGSWHNSTFVQNEALDSGGAFYVVTGGGGSTSHIHNSILWDNVAPTDSSIFGAGLDVQFSDIEGGYPGVGNLNVDPQFTGVARPQTGSPVNDAGSNSLIVEDFLDVDGDGNVSEPLPLDILENPRRSNDPLAPNTGEGSGPIVDMGAYERKIQGTTPP